MKDHELTGDKKQPASSALPSASLIPALLEIEASIMAGACRGKAALERIATTIASVSDITGAVVAMGEGSSLVTCASAGIPAPVGAVVMTGAELYEECIMQARMIRCEDSATDPRLSETSRKAFGSAVLLPLRARGTVVGVLAVFAGFPGVLGQEYILAFGTAAALCGMLVADILWAAPEQAAPQPQKVNEPEALQVMGPEALVAAEPKTFASAEPEIPPVPIADASVGGEEFSKSCPSDHYAPPVQDHSPSFTYDRAVTDDLRGAFLAIQVGSITSQDAGPAVPLKWFTRPVFVGAAILIFCGALFGSIQLLRGPRLAAKRVRPSPAALVTREYCSTVRSIGAPVFAATKPVSFDGGRVLFQVSPTYPAAAKEKRTEGSVKAIVSVNQKGIVSEVQITEGDPVLAEAAVAALSHWRFAPFLVDGNSSGIPAQIPVSLDFRIVTH